MAFGSSETAGRNQRRSIQYVCSCPHNKCKGTSDKSGRYRFHTSPESVKSCQRAYLLSEGYIQKSKREFINPETGYILVLSKKPARAKPGKIGRYMGRSCARIKLM